MTYTPGSTVQWRQSVGTVTRVLAAGQVHEVLFSDGQVIPCMGDVLKAAPSNVSILRPLTQEIRA